MKDSAFIRGNVPMTKEEIRTLVLSKLELQPDDKLMDIGAGTGSVSIEAALKMSSGHVTSIEHKEEAIALINKNISKHEISNIKVITTKAPEGMGDLSNINKYFIGGSGSYLFDILLKIKREAPSGSIVVVTAIIMDTMFTAYQYFKENNIEFELIQVGISKIDPQKAVPMLSARNPIFILTAKL